MPQPRRGARDVCVSSEHLEARLGGPLDRAGDQPVEVEADAQVLQEAQLLLRRVAIGGADLAGEQ